MGDTTSWRPRHLSHPTPPSDGADTVPVEVTVEKVGYWLFCDLDERDALQLDVAGLAVADGDVQLVPGWNLIGPVTDCPLPDNEGVIGPTWSWDAEEKTYCRVDETGMVTGRAYWICFVGGEDDTIDTGTDP